MKKAAATVSFLIAGVLILVVLVSFGIAVHKSYEQLDPKYRDAAVDESIAAANGQVVIEPGDSSLDDSTLLVCGLAGAAFLVAGFALWPKGQAASV